MSDAEDEAPLSPEEERELAAFLEAQGLDDGDLPLLREAAEALRGATAAPAQESATRARILASLGGSSESSRAESSQDEARAAHLERGDDDDLLARATEAYRRETATAAARPETRARVLASVRRGDRLRVAPLLAAAAAVLLVVSGSSALAATGNLGPVSELFEEMARDLGLADPAPAPREVPRPPRPARRGSAPAERAAEAALPAEAETETETETATETEAETETETATATETETETRAEAARDSARVALTPREVSPPAAVSAAAVVTAPAEVAPIERDEVDVERGELATAELAAAEVARAELAQGQPAPVEVAPSRPFDPREHELFREADRRRGGSDHQAALAAWDAYLAAYREGRYRLEARYGRALTLAQLGRDREALTALEPFVRGLHGGYRQREARAVSERLRARLEAPR